LAVAGAVLLGPAPRPADGDPPVLPRVLDPTRAEGDRLDRLVAAMLPKIQRKEAVVRQVIAGRLSLAGGVARFRQIESECPELEQLYRAALRFCHPDCEYDVAVARNLFATARQRLAADPAADPAVLPRLEAELAVLTRR
jgi:hypothetical protein